MKRLNWGLISRATIALFAVAMLGIGTPAEAWAEATGVSSNTTANADYSCRYYLVHWGDNLYRISLRFGVSIDAIMRANRLWSTRIYAGRYLCIPTETTYPPPYTGGSWSAMYWNNTSESGGPNWTTSYPSLNLNWGYGSPNPYYIFSEYFSAQYKRTYYFYGGTYRFTMLHDDGIRLQIDGNMVFDALSFVGGTTDVVDYGLSPGWHTLTVDYVQQAGLAYVRLTFYRVSSVPPAPQPPPTTSGPWNAQFFNNTGISGPPVATANYNSLNFNWGYGSPAANVPSTNWSATFVQYAYFNAGTYQFIATSDDGVQVFVDGNLVINQWQVQSARTFTANYYMGAGSHTILVKYFQAAGVAQLQVYWQFLG